MQHQVCFVKINEMQTSSQKLYREALTQYCLSSCTFEESQEPIKTQDRNISVIVSLYTKYRYLYRYTCIKLFALVIEQRFVYRCYSYISGAAVLKRRQNMYVSVNSPKLIFIRFLVNDTLSSVYFLFKQRYFHPYPASSY